MGGELMENNINCVHKIIGRDLFDQILQYIINRAKCGHDKIFVTKKKQ